MEALITAGIGLVVIVVVRSLLRRGLGRYERRLNARDPGGAPRRHTTVAFVRRVVIAFVVAIAVWQVLSLYPQTDKVVNALLASSAVLALFVGIAFNTPLSNLGSGLLVAFAQPLRLGDRVTVADQTGFVEEMSLLYTTLVTDDGRRVFIPNSQLTSSTIVNRTIRDPRRTVHASFPVRLDEVRDAREAALVAARALPGTLGEQARVLVGEISSGAVWLEVTTYAPLDADVGQLGSDLRDTILTTLGERGLLAST